MRSGLAVPGLAQSGTGLTQLAISKLAENGTVPGRVVMVPQQGPTGPIFLPRSLGPRVSPTFFANLRPLTYGTTFVAPITLLTHTVAGSSDRSTVSTSAIDTTGATLLVAACATSGTLGLTDSKSNTWVAMAASQDGLTQVFYVKNPTVGSGHTFSMSTGAFSNPAIAVASFSGTDTSQNVDQTNGNAVGGGLTLQLGSVTPSQNNELIVASLCTGSNPSTSTIDSSFTIIDQLSESGNNNGIALAYLVQTTAGAVNPTWTQSVANSSGGSIGTFHAIGH